jgi:hypothetical protein
MDHRKPDNVIRPDFKMRSLAREPLRKPAIPALEPSEVGELWVKTKAHKIRESKFVDPKEQLAQDLDVVTQNMDRIRAEAKSAGISPGLWCEARFGRKNRNPTNALYPYSSKAPPNLKIKHSAKYFELVKALASLGYSDEDSLLVRLCQGTRYAGPALAYDAASIAFDLIENAVEWIVSTSRIEEAFRVASNLGVMNPREDAYDHGRHWKESADDEPLIWEDDERCMNVLPLFRADYPMTAFEDFFGSTERTGEWKCTINGNAAELRIAAEVALAVLPTKTFEVRPYLQTCSWPVVADRDGTLKEISDVSMGSSGFLLEAFGETGAWLEAPGYVSELRRLEALGYPDPQATPSTVGSASGFPWEPRDKPVVAAADPGSPFVSILRSLGADVLWKEVNREHLARLNQNLLPGMGNVAAVKLCPLPPATSWYERTPDNGDAPLSRVLNGFRRGGCWKKEYEVESSTSDRQPAGGWLVEDPASGVSSLPDELWALADNYAEEWIEYGSEARNKLDDGLSQTMRKMLKARRLQRKNRRSPA